MCLYRQTETHRERKKLKIVVFFSVGGGRDCFASRSYRREKAKVPQLESDGNDIVAIIRSDRFLCLHIPSGVDDPCLAGPDNNGNCSPTQRCNSLFTCAGRNTCNDGIRSEPWFECKATITTATATTTTAAAASSSSSSCPWMQKQTIDQLKIILHLFVLFQASTCAEKMLIFHSVMKMRTVTTTPQFLRQMVFYREHGQTVAFPFLALTFLP